jgi:hypothetical protein
MITIKSSQKTFTEEETSRLTGLCMEHLHAAARSKRLGSVVSAAAATGIRTEHWQFTNADLSVLSALFSRCQH